jgi:uncharacterized membrane protein YkvA (DUF1232 family)
MGILEKLKNRAKRLKTEVVTLYYVARHPGTPWYAKLFVVCVVADALSPIDLIPDFIPIIGYLDDLLLLPLGIAIALRMVPASILIECRAKAQTLNSSIKRNWIAGAAIVLLWIILITLFIIWIML